MLNPFLPPTKKGQYPPTNQNYQSQQYYQPPQQYYYPPQGQQYYAQVPQQYYYPAQQQQQSSYVQYQNPFPTAPQQNNQQGPDQDIIVKCSLQEMVRRFFNDYVIVWYDAEIDSNENKQYIAQLERFCEVKTFTKWQEAATCVIESTAACHVITSGANGEELAKEIFSSKNVVQIYVFCFKKEQHEAWAKQYKNSCIETHIQRILDRIHANLLEWYQQKSSAKMNLPAFAPIFNDTDKSEMNNLHRLLKVIPNFKNRQQAKNDLMSLTKLIYRDEQNMAFITKFENEYFEYCRHNLRLTNGAIARFGILCWYTEEAFVYKITNNCLRIASADSIQYARLLLKDIERAIREEYKEKSFDFDGLLYRATYLSAEEWSNLKENVGREIEMHGFLSTSKDMKAPLQFLSDLSKQVWITILVPKGSTIEVQGFADLERYSRFPKEREILFNVRSRFTVIEAEEEWRPEYPCRHLVLLYGAQGFRKYTAEKNPVQEVVIKDLRRTLCAFCGVPAHQSSDGIFFSTFGDEKNRIFTCQKCLPQYLQARNAPLICIPLSKNSVNEFSFKTQIKGYNLAYPFEPGFNLPFYGYKCNNCQEKKRKCYFKCTECSRENGKNESWCEGCIVNSTKCLQTGHAVVLECYPYSIWCEKMTEVEAGHLKIQNEIVKYGDILQQAEMYFKNNQFEKAITFYKTFIQQHEHEENNKDLGTSYLKLGIIYRDQFQNSEALEFFVKALHIRKKYYGYNRPEAATCYDCIASILTRMEQYERALKYSFLAINIHHMFYGESADVAVCYCNIGDIYEKLGRDDDAIEYFSKSLKLQEKTQGKFHYEASKMMNRLGSVYQKKKDFKKALEYYQRALEIRKSIDGENHTGVAWSYNQIGLIYWSERDYKKALEYFTKNLQIKIAVDGNDSSETGTSYNNVGNAYKELGENKLALEHHLKALQIRANKTDHEDTVISYRKVGAAYRNLGDEKKAQEYYDKALKCQKLTHGKEDAETATEYYDVAVRYFNEDELEKALEHFLENLRIIKLINGDNHSQTALSSSCVARIFEEQKKYDQALQYYNQCLDIRKSFLTDDKSSIATCYMNIGYIYSKQGKYQEGRENYSQSLEMEISIHGENHAQVALMYCNIGTMHYNLNENDKALEFYFKCLEIRKSILGEIHSDVSTCYVFIGNTYSSLKEYNKALEYHCQALKVRKSLYGENHADVAASYNSIGNVYKNLNDEKKAIENYLKCLEIRKSVLGEEHTETNAVSEEIALIEQSLKQSTKNLD